MTFRSFPRWRVGLTIADAHEDIVTLRETQELIRTTFGQKDAQRGAAGTFMWFMQEVGELATALRSGDREEQMLEFADVLAWLATLANIAGVDLDEAMRTKYGRGCPVCSAIPCTCGTAEKP
jgi:NTP pyrophosphatase (non-canonical NTP hydrolase)